MKRVLASMACVVGLCGVITAVVAHHVIARVPEQSRGWTIDAKLTEKLKFHVGTLPPEAPPPVTTARDKAELVAIAFGCITFVLAVGSWIRGEGIALGVLASFLGVAAIAWEQTLFVLALFIFVGGPSLWYSWPASERGLAAKTMELNHNE